MYDEILNLLPYRSSFRFVDRITQLDQDEVRGEYRLSPDAWFYADHFTDNPVTPGVIITEIMAQIGVVVLGIYLLRLEQGERADGKEGEGNRAPLLSQTNISFYKVVKPGQTVTVRSQKEYFRFGKLKCRVEMQDEAGERIAGGWISGFVKTIETI